MKQKKSVGSERKERNGKRQNASEKMMIC